MKCKKKVVSFSEWSKGKICLDYNDDTNKIIKSPYWVKDVIRITNDIAFQRGYREGRQEMKDRIRAFADILKEAQSEV